ncbi:MAG TPA: hypothetical protein VFC51_03895 [Chloroflexota bacterium]|nr:hypothetical protein [Chloroflexota bacterium]
MGFSPQVHFPQEPPVHVAILAALVVFMTLGFLWAVLPDGDVV